MDILFLINLILHIMFLKDKSFGILFEKSELYLHIISLNSDPINNFFFYYSINFEL